MTDKERIDFLEVSQKSFRYIDSVTMDEKYPCWSVNGPAGNKKRKTLREAIDAANEIDTLD